MSSVYTTKRAYIELHLAVILWGFTAILGKWISLPALDLVWWRVGITSVSLLAFIKWGRTVWRLPRRLLMTYAGIGLLVGLHWVAFYGSIKLSNASICLVCMSTTSFFAALVEPIFTRKPVDGMQLGASLLIVPAMLLIASGLDADMLVGAGVGLLSALLAAVFSVLNKQYIKEADPYTITFVELFSAFVFLTIVMGVADFGRATSYMMPQTGSDWASLLVLALFCTRLTFVLSLRALTQISAFASTLVVNLEPVYGIILAAVLLHEYEQLSMSFYIGAIIIVLVVLLYPYLQRRYTVSH